MVFLWKKRVSKFWLGKLIPGPRVYENLTESSAEAQSMCGLSDFKEGARVRGLDPELA